jgi:TetR/AcrR family transcriptional regulator of autoinduction and epiphytic fitness
MIAPAPVKRGRPAASSRERVAKVARDLFVAHGFAAVSIDEIARRARVSKPTIYAHFGDKERLFLHILETACARLIAPLVSEDARGRPIAEILRNHAHHYSRAVLAPEVVALHRLCVGEAQRFPTISRRYFEQGPEMAHKALAAFLQERADAGEIDCPDCDLAAWHYASLVIATARTRLLFRVDDTPQWQEIDRMVASAVELFLRGIAADIR